MSDIVAWVRDKMPDALLKVDEFVGGCPECGHLDYDSTKLIKNAAEEGVRINPSQAYQVLVTIAKVVPDFPLPVVNEDAIVKLQDNSLVLKCPNGDCPQDEYEVWVFNNSLPDLVR